MLCSTGQKNMLSQTKTELALDTFRWPFLNYIPFSENAKVKNEHFGKFTITNLQNNKNFLFSVINNILQILKKNRKN